MENFHQPHMNDTPTTPDGDLLGTFKAAANSVALLYKEAQSQSKKSYEAGYVQSLRDVWQFVQERQSRQHTNGQESSTIPLNELLAFLESKHQSSSSSKELNPHLDPYPHPLPQDRSQYPTAAPQSSPHPIPVNSSSSNHSFHVDTIPSPPSAHIHPHSAPSLAVFDPNLPMLTQSEISADGLKRRWEMFHPRIPAAVYASSGQHQILESPSKRFRVRKDEQMTDE